MNTENYPPDSHLSPNAPEHPVPEGDSNVIDTDYVIGQDNMTAGWMGLKVDLHSQVFVWSSVVILFFVAITLSFPDAMGQLFNDTRSLLTNSLSWAFMLSTNLFVILAIVLIFSPLSRVRLGGTEARPDFGYLGWFAMLFAAGMGVGLMFYCVAEPLTYFGDLRSGTAGPLGEQLTSADEARSLSMATSIFHWGLHSWATYAIVSLALALFAFNKGLPLTSLVGIVLVMVFFITSSDSGSLVIDSITSGGKVSSPKTQRVFWVVIEGAIAIALLLGGGLTALQAAVLITGLPFMFVVLISGYSAYQGLRSEPRI